jgi:predicted RND superfamily exporter protein
MKSVFERLDRHPGWVIGIVAVVTALLAIPMITMEPTESASTEPTGPVFDARDAIDERFVSSVFPVFFIVEADDGNVADAESLRDLSMAEEQLRRDLGDSLFSYFDVETGTDVSGLVSLADLTDSALGGQLMTASDDEVEAAAAAIIDDLGADSELLGLSTLSERNTDGTWTVPAISLLTLSDNDVLGFGNQSTNLGGSTEAEEYARSVQEALRSAETLSVYGVAMDVNLTSQEQGALAGPFIGFTILAVLLIVGVVFRSYWVLATVGVALGALIIWLKGITNLLGFDNDLVLSLIVPIAMISFGVDFAFHAVGRYREERADGAAPRVAFTTGLSAVSAALVLALTSDTIAFLSNITAGIESIVNFGLGAAIALAAAFLLLGVVTPLVVSRIEHRVGPAPIGRRATITRIAGGLGAGSLVMASVLLMVFVLPWAGVALFAATVFVVLVAPFDLRTRRVADVTEVARPVSSDPLAVPVGRVVAGLARRPAIVLPIALLVTAAASVFAFSLPTEFDVEDFFSSDSDFVIALDLLDTHVGDRGGEPAQVYIEADLEDPTALASIAAAVDRIRALDTDVLARGEDGVLVSTGALAVLDAVWEHPIAQAAIAQRSGVQLTDADNDGIPDSSEQLAAVWSVATEIGVPFDETRLALTPDDVNTAIDLDAEPSATVLSMGLVNSRSQASITDAEEALTPIVDGLRSELGGTIQLTGSPFVREASLEATSRALRVSLPIAVVLCLLVAGVFLRSMRFGVASVLPILMTVAWLYGFMEVAGYAINIVTATIAAVSIGVGIDFAIHFIVRYREELDRLGDRFDAVRVAGEGTGTALLASALSSSIGFGILAFAPMPLFAAYGFLTAVMIAMAATATLVVLPSILVLITADRVDESHSSVPEPAAA